MTRGREQTAPPFETKRALGSAGITATRIVPEITHSKNPIGVVRGSEVIDNSLQDDTTDAKCHLHFNSVWFCLNGVSNLQNFV